MGIYHQLETMGADFELDYGVDQRQGVDCAGGEWRAFGKSVDC